MAKYEIPETDYENMMPEDADKALERINADIYEAGKEHPLFDPKHPLHQAHVDHNRKLNMVSVRKEGEPLDLGAAKAEQDEAEMEALRQQHLVNDAQKEIEALVALGKNRIEVPDDVKPYEVRAWTIQRLAAEAKFSELTPMMEKELVVLGSSDLEDFHNIIQNTSLAPKFRAHLIEQILEKCCQKNRQIFGIKVE